jgi:uncharacterized membrane protein
MLSVYRIIDLKRIYFHRTEMDRVLILSCLFSLFLAFSRVVYTGQLMFLSLIWNLFLGFIPFAITRLLSYRPHWIKNKWKFSLTITIWLLFIPNSFYIITDLFHLEERSVIPLWFDLALIFSFAWNGLLLGVLSVRQMEKIWEAKWQWSEVFFIYPIMFLNALGIYIGRYLRYNSWDVISNPLGLSEDIVYLIIHPIRHRFDWSMIFCFSVFMTLLYLSIKKISKELLK